MVLFVGNSDAIVDSFFPSSLTSEDSSCNNGKSWTPWFNTGKPSKLSGDNETTSVVKEMHPLHMCAKPYGFHAQSLTDPTDGYQTSVKRDGMGVVKEFSTNLPEMDFKIRYCCQTTEIGQTTIATIQTTRITAKTTTIATTTTTVPLPIDNAQCGRQEIAPLLGNNRIFGGSHAIPNSWPWIVSYEENKPCAHDPSYTCTGNCGGTIIDSRHVLTAAHCINTQNPTKITITGGIHNKLVLEKSKQVMQVERIFIHPGYNNKSIENDIAILRLSSPVQINKHVQIACLPGPDPQHDTTVIVSGWGSQHMGGSSYDQLKQASVKVVGNCKRFWGSQVNEAKQICVGDSVNGYSVCKGDSGGPILHKSNGQWVVSGVGSFVSDCKTHDERSPNVFTRVSAYKPWIRSIIA